ncbi:MAG: cell division protein FtsZ [Hyphomicrobiaceae bacterium]
MSIDPQLPKPADLKPRITVVGVGGAGGNAINNMIASGLDGVEYIVANTDAQALAMSSAERRIQLGVNLTEGLGAGSKPEIGEAAAQEAVDDIRTAISGSHMVFIAAGMGGGTGTGAAGVVARIAKELDILTVGIVTRPFQFEGSRRARAAEMGIAELKKYVDTLIVIPNQNLFRVATEKTTFSDAFRLADQVLYSGVACIVDLIVKDGLINLDFADVRTVMTGMGSAMMGTGEAAGDRRATLAAEEAISNPLLDDVSLQGAKGLLLSIIGGPDMTLYEVDEAASRVRQEVDPEANIILGAAFDETLGDRIRVAIVASGLARPGTHDARMSRDVGPPPTPRDRNGARANDMRAPTDVDWAPRSDYGIGASELQRQLSQALEGGQAHADSHPERDRADRTDGRTVWKAPGGVVIEQGAGPSGDASEPQADGPPAGSRKSAGFTPSPPSPLKRGRRPMPEIADFPEVAQREYHSKTDPLNGRVSAPRNFDDAGSSVPPRRRGLLQRLVDAGRGRRPAEDASPDVAAGSERPLPEDPTLPAFVKRDRR